MFWPQGKISFFYKYMNKGASTKKTQRFLTNECTDSPAYICKSTRRADGTQDKQMTRDQEGQRVTDW